MLILPSCCVQKQTDKRIAKIEKVVDKRQTKALNSLVSDFEKNLTKIYPDLSTQIGYGRYLNGVFNL